MISTVIFDLGNIFVTVDHDLIFSNIKKELNNHFSIDELKHKFEQSAARKSYELGAIDSDTFYKALKSELQIDISQMTLRKCWQEIFTGIDGTISMLPELKKQVKLGMISDTNPWHIDIIGEQFDIFGYFDDMIFSYDVNLTKPNPQIFKLGLERMNSEPESCVYVDDLEINIEAARRA